jgi:hypothetical protein
VSAGARVSPDLSIRTEVWRTRRPFRRGVAVRARPRNHVAWGFDSQGHGGAENGLCGRTDLEVLGESDVLNLWRLATVTPPQEQVQIHVMQSGYLALLDRRFVLQMLPLPETFPALMRREIWRTRRMMLRACILSRSLVDERLELMLWRLAEQSGA